MKKRVFATLGIIALNGLFAATSFAEPGYEPGHGALEVFDGAGMAVTPMWVQVWMMIMVATFAAGLIFVIKQPIARWAVGGFVVPFLVSGPIYSALGWPFLAGAIALNHLIFWAPAAYLLLTKRPFMNGNYGRWFRLWTGVMTGVIVISFAFDIPYAFVYLSHVLS